VLKQLAVFLDRDGVINRKRPKGDYVKNWKEFEFLPDVLTAVRLLTEARCLVIVVTNQRGIARGLMSESDLESIHANMICAFEDAGAAVTALYYCPHEVGSCACRKPGTGLLLRATHDYPEIDRRRAVLIGDSLTDLETAHRFGCRSILVADRGAAAILAQAAARSVEVGGIAASLLGAVEMCTQSSTE
jgi:D-glycero-D-manno-heptose 1,7-bisphosphate phosphatase